MKGSKRLMERPQTVYETLALEQGFQMEKTADEIRIKGRLESGIYVVDGSISSQFITGLIFALLCRSEDSRIQLTGKVESRSYIDLTLAAVQKFGFSVIWLDDRTLLIRGGDTGMAQDVTVEGDYSNAAFLEAFNLLNGQVEVTGLRKDSLQGDKIYLKYYEELKKGCPELSLADCPDLGPVLFVLAAAMQGGVFNDTARLKIKESDRGAAMAAELRKCGVKLELQENRIIVPGGCLCKPEKEIDGHNDHRIVMAMSLLLSQLGGRIRGAEAVSKSMPDFFQKVRSLGIEVREYEAE